MTECNYDESGCTNPVVDEFVVEFVTDDPFDTSPFRYRLCEKHAAEVRDDINNDPNWVIKE